MLKSSFKKSIMIEMQKSLKKKTRFKSSECNIIQKEVQQQKKFTTVKSLYASIPQTNYLQPIRKRILESMDFNERKRLLYIFLIFKKYLQTKYRYPLKNIYYTVLTTLKGNAITKDLILEKCVKICEKMFEKLDDLVNQTVVNGWILSQKSTSEFGMVNSKNISINNAVKFSSQRMSLLSQKIKSTSKTDNILFQFQQRSTTNCKVRQFRSVKTLKTLNNEFDDKLDNLGEQQNYSNEQLKINEPIFKCFDDTEDRMNNVLIKNQKIQLQRMRSITELQKLQNQYKKRKSQMPRIHGHINDFLKNINKNSQNKIFINDKSKKHNRLKL